MSEYMEYAWGITDVKRDLNTIGDVDQFAVNPVQALGTFKELILSRPDVGFLRTDTPFVLRFLRARKFDPQESFSVYVNYYTFMHKNREFFMGFNVNNPEVQQALEDGLPGVLPQKDSQGRRILVMFASQWDPTRCSLLAIHKAIYLTLEYLLNDVSVQERGIVMIIDWSNFSFRQCSKLQPAILRGIVEGLEYSFPIRVRSVHCVGQPWYVEAAMTLLKPFLRDSSKRKMQSHGHNLSSLHQQINKEILPAELGGERPAYQAAQWIQQLQKPATVSQSDSTSNNHEIFNS